MWNQNIDYTLILRCQCLRVNISCHKIPKIHEKKVSLLNSVPQHLLSDWLTSLKISLVVMAMQGHRYSERILKYFHL